MGRRRRSWWQRLLAGLWRELWRSGRPPRAPREPAWDRWDEILLRALAPGPSTKTRPAPRRTAAAAPARAERPSRGRDRAQELAELERRLRAGEVRGQELADLINRGVVRLARRGPG